MCAYLSYYRGIYIFAKTIYIMMTAIEYFRPLYELRKLAEVFDRDLFLQMSLKKIGTINESMMEYLITNFDLTRSGMDIEIPADHDAYIGRVKELWRLYKSQRFHTLKNDEIIVLNEYLDGYQITADDDIFLHLSTQNPAIESFQHALGVDSVPVLLVTNDDIIGCSNGVSCPEVRSDDYHQILFYRDLSFSSKDFFQGWINTTWRKGNYGPSLLLRGGYSNAGYDLMLITDSKTDFCRIDVPEQVALHVRMNQMPNYDPIFYIRLKGYLGLEKDLEQTMDCIYGLPEESLAQFPGNRMKYYYPGTESCIDITVANRIDDPWNIPVGNGLTLTKDVCVFEDSCYMLDGTSLTAYYEGGDKNKLCIDYYYEEMDIVILKPHKDQKLISDPRFMQEINRILKGIRLKFKSEYRTLTTKELAFCCSFIRLSDVLSLKARIGQCLEDFKIEIREDQLQGIVHDMMTFRDKGFLTPEFLLCDALLNSKRGKRKKEGGKMSRRLFLNEFSEVVKGWGIKTKIFSKTENKKPDQMNWKLFAALFGCPLNSLDNWRKTLSLCNIDYQEYTNN